MKNVSITNLKSSLSNYITQVKNGEDIIVTDRGSPVAKLIPFKEWHHSNRKTLAKKGIINIGKGKLSNIFFKPSPISDLTNSTLKALLEEREAED